MNHLLREIARFLFPRMNCRQFLQDTSYQDSIRSLVREGVGGFVLFDGTVDDAARAVAEIRGEENGEKLLLAADCEFGLTMRFDEGTEFPSAWALGSADDLSLTYRVALAIAYEMRRIGIDWNFAPVLDVNTNPENPIINLRAFGEEAEAVAAHGTAYIRGLRDGGVISCAKHFPGHGDTAVDSHIALPVLTFGRDRLEEIELMPFRQAIADDVPAIMAAHLAVPAIDPSGTPASLSGPILTDLLRGDLGFQGAIVTDALDMGAIVEMFGTEQAAVRAFLAGNDVLEIPDDPLRALEGLRQAVVDGTISAERINESSRRLDALLQWRDSRPQLELSSGWQEEHRELALTAARSALQINLSKQSLAVEFSNAAPTAALILRDETAKHSAERWGKMLTAAFDLEVFEIESGGENSVLDSDLQEKIQQVLGEGGKVILSLMIRPRGGAGSVGLGRHQNFVTDLLRNRSSVLINFGNPYLLRSAAFALRIDAYSTAQPSLIGALERLKEYLIKDRLEPGR